MPAGALFYYHSETVNSKASKTHTPFTPNCNKSFNLFRKRDIILHMTKYRLIIKLDSDLTSKVMHNIFSETAEDWGMRVDHLELIKVRQTGRPRKNTKKLDQWIEKRHRPFTNDTFAKYMGMSRSASWRKLEGLVKAGVYTKIKDREGRVEYHRPDNPVVGE